MPQARQIGPVLGYGAQDGKVWDVPQELLDRHPGSFLTMEEERAIAAQVDAQASAEKAEATKVQHDQGVVRASLVVQDQIRQQKIALSLLDAQEQAIKERRAPLVARLKELEAQAATLGAGKLREGPPVSVKRPPLPPPKPPKPERLQGVQV